ncbi:MAG: hypothetical protein JWN38_1140 [Candidatus Saccharibacteria bacterium]|nr:hypothetical protein [Candidatus Saccharibacteria bacterium]
MFSLRKKPALSTVHTSYRAGDTYFNEYTIDAVTDEGKRLVNVLRTRPFGPSEMALPVQRYLNKHAAAFGSQPIANLRLSLYNEVERLTPEQIASRLELIITLAIARCHEEFDTERFALDAP